MGAVLGMIYVGWIYSIITDKTRIPLDLKDLGNGMDSGGESCAEVETVLGSEGDLEDPKKDRANNDKMKCPVQE